MARPVSTGSHHPPSTSGSHPGRNNGHRSYRYWPPTSPTQPVVWTNLGGFRISTTEHCHPTESVGLIGGDSLTELQRLTPHLTAEKGGIWVFLGEECCCYANQSGIVKETRQGKETRKHFGIQDGRAGPIGSPLAGPLTMLLIILRALCDKPPHGVHLQLDERH
jgi:hypothetical protein